MSLLAINCPTKPQSDINSSDTKNRSILLQDKPLPLYHVNLLPLQGKSTRSTESTKLEKPATSIFLLLQETPFLSFKLATALKSPAKTHDASEYLAPSLRI